ncbi:putative RiPP precursor [Ruminococcus flavefaciens]|nr:putative RiPP precursor [Ruminococcus flavefaciens]
MTYSKPKFEQIASFKKDTLGILFGKKLDVFGSKGIFIWDL